ncbi:MAG: hypothetical protein ABI539_11360 [Acidobacteriota bacterium]
MSNFDNPLKNIKIASTCSAGWDQMFGDERKRFCGECKLNVYNLSGMTSYDAENLLRNSEGRMCVRFYQRADGTILTKDCPVGWARLKKRISTAATAVVSMLLAVLTGLFFVSLVTRPRVTVRKVVMPLIEPEPRPMMGAIAVKDADRIPQMGKIKISPEGRN